MRRTLAVSLVFAFLTVCAQAQDEDKARQLFEAAIKAMGGETFLNVKDIVSEGQYFGFNREGESSGLIRFTDYTKLPDKSRHESGNKKKELDISVFNLEKNEGWILEGQKPVREANPEEMKDFKDVVKHSLDIIFRIRYKDPENKIFYLGPGEGSDVTLEMIKIVDPDNDETTVYIDRITNLPVKIEYRDVNKRGIRMRLVDEFSQWHVFQGVNTPLRTDGYINGRRSTQTFVIKISYNNNLPDSFFSKPLPPK